MNERVALYGGSFNPIHIGHLITARAIAEHLSLNSVVFLPTSWPPHKTAGEATDSFHRAEMVKLAIAGEPGFEFSDFDLTRAGPTYTIDTVKHFAGVFGAGVELFWIIGADSLPDLGTWHRIVELIDICTVLTAMRPGNGQLNWDPLRSVLGDARVTRLQIGQVATPRIEVSSTDIRNRARLGLSIRFLVPETVHEYIKRHRLFGDVGV